MPSVKSYQNRKAEIKKLNEQLAESEYQLKKAQGEISCLAYELRVKKASAYLVNEMHSADAKIIDALSNKVAELERKIRIYRQYIRYGESYYPEPHIETINIPTCLKPLDALEYIGKKIEIGPDNISQ